jgi:antitoxin component YwqK of YwqJK toxin-antitoxin module
LQSGRFERGLETGVWSFFHPNGAKSEEGPFVNGKPNGLWKQWRSDGTLAQVGSYMDGWCEGEWMMYDVAGKSKTQVVYRRGR